MKRSLQSGMTMIEVLITILVLAIGLTGVMAMESLAIKTNHNAYLRTQVILQAQEMADRMHANLKGVSDGNYVMSATVADATTATPSPNCLTATCNTAQLAAFDKWEWIHQGNGRVLPAGSTASISYDSTLETHTITISWSEQDTEGVETRTFNFVYKPLPIYLL